jgi:hypothetical protein
MHYQMQKTVICINVSILSKKNISSDASLLYSCISILLVFSFLKEALLGFYQSLFKMCVGVCVFNKKTCL